MIETLAPSPLLRRTEPSVRRASTAQILRHYFCSVAVYGFLLGFIWWCPWYRELLSVSVGSVRAIDVYFWLYGAYLLLAPVVFFAIRPAGLWESKNLLIVGYLGRRLRHALGFERVRDRALLRAGFEEKHAMAFLLIKLYYGPLMLNSFFLECAGVPSLLQQLRMQLPTLFLLDRVYLLFVSAVFLVDSALFFAGYHTESGLLRNRLRYAETNLFRILVCVACYPPFNMATGAFFGPSNADPAILYRGDLTHPLTWILRGLAVLSLVLLTSASLSLFTRASNLTNRGIVDWGPYRFVRHPGYVGKNLFWLFTLLPLLMPNFASPQFTWMRHVLFSLVVIWGALGWGTLYYLRAVTEEQFLSQDPDYVAYRQRVRYRFIPGVI